jgi:hypothetical protein
MRVAATALLTALGVLGPTVASAAIRQFSYDPADAETRQAAGPVTMVIRQSMFGVRVLKLRSTDAKATADLAPADGRGPAVDRGAGDKGDVRSLYQITSGDDGPALLAALCPGSQRGWLALSPVRYGEDVHAVVLGDDPKGGPVRRCRTLNFSFHGEWRLPQGQGPTPEPNVAPDFPG